MNEVSFNYNDILTKKYNNKCKMHCIQYIAVPNINASDRCNTTQNDIAAIICGIFVIIWYSYMCMQNMYIVHRPISCFVMRVIMATLYNNDYSRTQHF